MSRSGYVENYDSEDQWASIRWRGAVASAIRGRRGQAFLKEMAAALDAMPEKALIAEELAEARPDGSVCALGALGKSRGIDMSKIDPEEFMDVAAAFSIPQALAQEIMWENDECGKHAETPEERWARVRKWVQGKIKSEV